MSLAPQSASGAELPGSTPELHDMAVGEAPTARQGRDIWRQFRKNKLAVIGLAIVVILVILAVIGPYIVPFNPTGIFVHNNAGKHPPSSTFWFGTDQIGRDIFSRVIAGTRYSLVIGAGSAAVSVFLGVIFGALAGYYGKWIDSLLMRITDIFLAMPYIILAIAMVVVFGHQEWVIIAVLGGLGWMPVARVFRSSILQVKQLEFIEAARAIGCSDSRIIVRHIVPNAIQPVIVFGTLFTGTAILSEAALSFLGVGAQDPTPSWGLMMVGAPKYLQHQPFIPLFPGLAIFVTVMAFVFLGDGLRDALDPKLRK